MAHIAVMLSESTRASKSKANDNNNILGKDFRKRNVFRYRRKIDKDGDDCKSGGREWLQQLETTGDRQLTVGKMGRAVGMISTSEVLGEALVTSLYLKYCNTIGGVAKGRVDVTPPVSASVGICR